MASSSSGTSFSRAEFRLDRGSNRLVLGAQGGAGSDERRCKSSHARLQGKAMASSPASSSSVHFLAQRQPLHFWRSSVGGASRRALSPNRDAVRNSPQRRPRKQIGAGLRGSRLRRNAAAAAIASNSLTAVGGLGGHQVLDKGSR